MKDGIYIITKSKFPETLQNTPGVPRKLYARGRLLEDEGRKYLCVIGSRRSTRYGADCVDKILKGLAGYPITIVSGLAIGIDGIAHDTALRYGLHCVAFPGSTLDRGALYPACNSALAERIVDAGGALLSPWEPGYDTSGKWAFPSRNKLMAGISHAVLIIEAGQGSGALMTAQYAANIGRDVLAVAGSIFSGNSYGPLMLIRDGARIVTGPGDILEELGFSPADDSRLPSIEVGTLDAESQRLFEIITAEDTTIDRILDEMRIPMKVLNEKLSFLEIKNLIRIDGDSVSAAR